MSEIVTAAMLVIGDEILSGRTKDRNLGHLAEMLTAVGIDLREARVVPDDEAEIVQSINALRSRYTYVFTSGGIGPTHDDITADAIASAFGLPCDYDPQAYAMMEKHYAARGMEFTDARKRMARMPVGAAHIRNPVSMAPGFQVGNVYVMAGVPAVFQAMLDMVIPQLKTGVRLLSESVPSRFAEGTIGSPLAEIQKRHPDTVIGSYPKYEGGSFWTELVIRSRSQTALQAARADVEAMLAELEAAERSA